MYVLVVYSGIVSRNSFKNYKIIKIIISYKIELFLSVSILNGFSQFHWSVLNVYLELPFLVYLSQYLNVAVQVTQGRTIPKI